MDVGYWFVMDRQLIVDMKLLVCDIVQWFDMARHMKKVSTEIRSTQSATTKRLETNDRHDEERI